LGLVSRDLMGPNLSLGRLHTQRSKLSHSPSGVRSETRSKPVLLRSGLSRGSFGAIHIPPTHEWVVVSIAAAMNGKCDPLGDVAPSQCQSVQSLKAPTRPRSAKSRQLVPSQIRSEFRRLSDTPSRRYLRLEIQRSMGTAYRFYWSETIPGALSQATDLLHLRSPRLRHRHLGLAL
jgi:hypothetical protein